MQRTFWGRLLRFWRSQRHRSEIEAFLVTETTLNANGQAIKVEITVTRDGQFLSKVQEILDPATGLLLRREEKIVVNGRVIERKFELLNGVLTLVQDEGEHQVEHEQEAEHGPGHR